ncbi:alcohol dehydrogenase catalytic domain-containing protein [Nonomuraea sp. NPDC049028]|uniref:alcohol dehydrogenase catalytic domain-containing protein n=1 Tax=Nonomuraea sp. NPDC049028 TaxID=3364348 RepID=UPI003723F45D
MYGFKQPLRVEEAPIPEPNPDEVLIKVQATGMCRSDYQLLDGYFPVELTFPYIPGHEIAGRVAQLGTGIPASAGLSEGVIPAGATASSSRAPRRRRDLGDVLERGPEMTTRDSPWLLRHAAPAPAEPDGRGKTRKANVGARVLPRAARHGASWWMTSGKNSPQEAKRTPVGVPSSWAVRPPNRCRRYRSGSTGTRSHLPEAHSPGPRLPLSPGVALI